MKLSSAAFWDVDMQMLDAQAHADFIIRKVFDYGLMEDVCEVMRFYPKERIVESLLSAPHLDKKTLTFASAYYGHDLKHFKCYTRRQLTSSVSGY